MAVAFIMWAKASELVSSLVNDVLMPAILKPAMEAAKVSDLAQLATPSGILYGKFLATAVDFVIVWFIVYLIVTYMVNTFGPKKES